MRTDTAQPVRLAEYTAPHFQIPQVYLAFRLARTATEVNATLSITPQADRPAGAPLVLDIDDISPVDLAIDGVAVEPSRILMDEAKLVITGVPDAPFTLTCRTIINPSENSQLMGLFRTGSAYCTQCEAEGFRRIIPFIDRPDVLSRYTTRIEAHMDDAPILLSNGNRTEAGKLADGWHYAVWNDPFPKPSYLFALVGGALDVVRDTFRTMSGRDVALEIYVEPGRGERCAFAMESLQACMRWDEEAFGREYDLDIFMIVAVSDFNMGAMENKGLNIFNDKYILALPETATDTDYVNIEAIIAHEYFHNWTGNRITCRDWFQLCLKEGLTVFRDQEFTADMRSRPVKRIGDVRSLRTIQFVEDSGPLAHPVRPEVYHEINNFYSATVYEKGAEVIRMLKTLLGDTDFRRGMDLYFERYDGTAATVEQFVSCFAQASGRDLTQFMRWYGQAGTPALDVTGSYDAAKGLYTLDIEQTVPPTPGQNEKQPMLIPLRLALLGSDGRELPLEPVNDTVHGDILEISSGLQSISFKVPERPVPSLLRGFSAPVRLNLDLDDADMLFALQHDSDPFNRWQAGQTLALRRLTGDCGRGDGGGIDATALADAFGKVLGDTSLDHAFRAMAIALPSEIDIAREIGSNIDPDVVHAARMGLRKAISIRLLPQLEAIYASVQETGPYTPDAASTGRRALKNALLDLICANDTPAAAALAWAQFSAAHNMTDRLAALNALVNLDTPFKAMALKAFAAQGEHDPLVLDKWFALQAAVAGHGTLDTVLALTAHPAFSYTNPNRVRAVVGTFGFSNPTGFNRPDGAGYAFLADTVLRLDPKNPQVAARMASAFRTWRSLEPERRTLAEHQLRRILETPALSADLADVVRRSLQ